MGLTEIFGSTAAQELTTADFTAKPRINDLFDCALSYTSLMSSVSAFSQRWSAIPMSRCGMARGCCKFRKLQCDYRARRLFGSMCEPFQFANIDWFRQYTLDWEVGRNLRLLPPASNDIKF